MPDTYPILEVEQEWVLEPETMGSKDKFWYKQPEKDVNWLFKYPQPNTGQHWAEKIAARLRSYCKFYMPRWNWQRSESNAGQ